MRYLVSILGFAALMGCNGDTTPMDSGQQINDSGTDVQDVLHQDTPHVEDTNTMCDFEPGIQSVTCRILHSTCTTGPITCGDGTHYDNIMCECQSVQMFGQVWRCDNMCGSAADAGTD